MSFYIGTFPKSACDYSYLVIDTTSPNASAEHNIGFGENGVGQKSGLQLVKLAFEPAELISRPTESRPLQVDQLLQSLLENPPSPHDKELLLVDERELPPASSLLTVDGDGLSEYDLGLYFKAMWARLGWMLRVAENVESNNEVWAEDSYPGMQELRERTELWGSAALLQALAIWVSTNRAFRNQGWYAYNTWSARSSQERRDQLKRAQYLLSRLEAELGRYHTAAT